MENLTFVKGEKVGIGLWLDEKPDGGVALVRCWQSPYPGEAKPPEIFELSDRDWAALLLHGIQKHLPAMLKVTARNEPVRAAS